MTEAVGDAFTIENVTAVDEFLLELFKFARIESGYACVGAVHGNPFALG